MRFELNFAAVVRNVAVLANVANLAVDRFVAVVHPVLHWIGYAALQVIELMRRQSACESCLSPSNDRLAAMSLAYAVVSPEREITHRWRQESLSSKRGG